MNYRPDPLPRSIGTPTPRSEYELDLVIYRSLAKVLGANCQQSRGARLDPLISDEKLTVSLFPFARTATMVTIVAGAAKTAPIILTPEHHFESTHSVEDSKFFEKSKQYFSGRTTCKNAAYVSVCHRWYIRRTGVGYLARLGRLGNSSHKDYRAYLVYTTDIVAAAFPSSSPIAVLHAF